MTRAAQRPIGVFDSGLGGLTLVREIRRRMPQESIVYFGDMARLPYGIKSKEQILRFSVQNTLFLLSKKVKAVVVACNSSSSAAYRFLKKHFNLPVVDVIEPAVEAALEGARQKKIGVIATQATIDSAAYSKAILRKRRSIRITTKACPLFVPLVEEGWFHSEVTRQVVRDYLAPIKQKSIDTLILGCTHYPLLRGEIQHYLGKKVTLVDSIRPTVDRLEKLLKREGLMKKVSSSQGKLTVYLSDRPRNFVKIGQKFLGEKIKRVEVVRQKS